MGPNTTKKTTTTTTMACLVSLFPLAFILLLFAQLSTIFGLEDGLLENGDFETAPPNGFGSGPTNGGVVGGSVEEAGTGGFSPRIPGWVTNGTVELVRSGQKQGGMILIVPQGSQAVRLGNDAEIGQVLQQLEKDSTYAITFSAARTCAQLESLNVSFDGGAREEGSQLPSSSSATVDLQTLYSVDGWDAYSWAFKPAGDSGRLVFRNLGMEEDPTCGPIIDNIAIKKLFVPDSSKDNVVVNGDFEEGPWMFPNATLGVLLPTNLDQDTTSLPGWMVESNRAVRFVDSYHFTVPQGKRAVELLSGKEGIISQMVATSPGKQYSLSFTMGTAGDSCQQQPLAVMAFAGDQAQNTHYTPMGNMTHQLANLTFTAKAEKTRVAFYSVYYNIRTDDRSSLCGPVVDDVRVSSVSAGSARVFLRPRAHLLGPAMAVWLLMSCLVLFM